MSEKTISRRRFCQLAGSTLLVAPSLMRGQSSSSSSLTAREVLERIKKNVGVPWHFPTCDEFKIGDPDAPITGITTTFMSTFDLCRRSAAAGNNFVISHEPTFWNATDRVSDLKEDPLYEQKVEFLKEHKMVVMRFHDHWHARRPDGIISGWDKRLGWEEYAVQGPTPFSHEYVIPETSLGELAKYLETRLNARSIRYVGDPNMKVARLGHAGHYISQCMETLPKVDVLVVGESREWEAAEYVRDAIAAGQNKALVQLPHAAGEEAGMEECARWLKTFVNEVPIQFIPSGDPFWIA